MSPVSASSASPPAAKVETAHAQPMQRGPKRGDRHGGGDQFQTPPSNVATHASAPGQKLNIKV